MIDIAKLTAIRVEHFRLRGKCYILGRAGGKSEIPT